MSIPKDIAADILRSPLVVANWKMNGSQNLCAKFSTQLRDFSDVDIWLAPPLAYLPTLLGYKRFQGIVALGAQNVHEKEHGAYTGEVSAAMVADIGGTFAIVGHSERRTMCHENNTMVTRKLQSCVSANIVPVLCVGESLEQRQNGLAHSVVQQQLQSLESVLETLQLDKIVVAYEPIWAIGTGISASPSDAEEMQGQIRSFLGNDASKLRILYGGSVKPDNAEELINQPNVDGFLVGGASLDPRSFDAICQVVSGT